MSDVYIDDFATLAALAVQDRAAEAWDSILMKMVDDFYLRDGIQQPAAKAVDKEGRRDDFAALAALAVCVGTFSALKRQLAEMEEKSRRLSL